MNVIEIMVDIIGYLVLMAGGLLLTSLIVYKMIDFAYVKWVNITKLGKLFIEFLYRIHDFRMYMRKINEPQDEEE